MIKKFLSAFLAILILMSVVPANAFAATGLQVKVVPSKTTAAPGEEITYSVVLGPVTNMISMQMVLDIPSGLTYVANSGALASGIKDTLKFDAADWTEQSLMINGGGSFYTYTSTKDTVLGTFKCKVNSGTEGKTISVGLTNLEFYNGDFIEIISGAIPGTVKITGGQPEQYTISFEANGGSGVPTNQTKIHGVDLTLSNTKPTRDGYTFAGWNTAKDGKGKSYAAGGSFTANEKATLYAQWTKNTTTSTTSTTKSTTKPTTTTTKSTTKPTSTTTKSTTKPTTTTTKSTTKPTTTTTKPTTAPTTKPTTPAGGVQLKRLAGAGRQQTAALISKEAYSSAENVFIASGDNAADALAGVPLASAMNAPILLIRPAAGLDADTKAEIVRLKAKNVYILGGEGAIPAKVEKDIQALGCKTSRVAGDDRFATAVKIAEKLKELKGSPTEVFFVYSHNYPDALAVSGVAAVKGAPILYVYGDGDLRASSGFMQNTKTVQKAYIIGGYAAIKEAADTNVKKYATVQRVYGDNRYLTCDKINAAFASTLTGKSVCMATGKNFPDALAGGVLAAKTKSPMLLVGDSLLDYQSTYIKTKKPSTLYVFGGTGAVSEVIANDAVKAAKQ